MGKKKNVFSQNESIKSNNANILNSQLIGKVEKNDDGRFVFKCDNGRVIHIPQNNSTEKYFNENQKCVLSLTDNNFEAFGNIEYSLGNADDPIVEGKAIAMQYNLTNGFSDEAINEANNTAFQPVDSKNDYSSTKFVTIDPTTSKDFDDAVFCEKNEDGSFTLKVAIANVSKYVKPNSTLFNEAMAKGNSSYLGEMCYPMLPKVLSNGCCSLREDEPRYTLNTTINYTPKGRVKSYEISTGIIKSSKRLTYKEAEEIHENKNGGHIKFFEQKENIDALYELSNILKERRINRGAFNIGSRAPAFILNEDKTKVLDIVADHAESSTFIIESCMIACNEVWADFADRTKTPFIYRIHNQIDYDSELELRDKLNEFNIYLPKEPTGFDLQEIINKVEGSNLKEPITALVLRSLPHAKYSTINEGHVGLGVNANHTPPMQNYILNGEKLLDSARSEFFKNHGNANGFACKFHEENSRGYGHTTSPIRRGADLLNQYQLTSLIETGSPQFSKSELGKYCKDLNELEINSDKAESKYDSLLTALWAKENLGSVVEGVIIDNVKGKLTILNPCNYIKFKIPREETFIGETQSKNTKNDKRYSIGGEIKAQIFDATTIPKGEVYASENLHKVEDMKSNNKKPFEMSCDPKYY